MRNDYLMIGIISLLISFFLLVITIVLRTQFYIKWFLLFGIGMFVVGAVLSTKGFFGKPKESKEEE